MTNLRQASEPAASCTLCPRLAEFRAEWNQKEPAWHNAPVPSFGPQNAEVLVVGLAPGLRGANATGRPFTGDYAGDLLYATLLKFGFATGDYQAHPNDGLTLQNLRITNAVRCVPPENKPTGPEIRQCNSFLAATFQEMPRLKAILCLGLISHNATLEALEQKKSAFKFSHGAQHMCGQITVFDSYHCSRYNTSTKRLTKEMFESVFLDIKQYLKR